MESIYRKELGNWGELQLDQWLSKQEWEVIEKNLKIPGGEIDRVYLKRHTAKPTFCVAEVKTNVLYSVQGFSEIFSEVGIKKYMKQRQIRNIYKFGERLLTKHNALIYLRLFIVLQIKNNININSFFYLKQKPYKNLLSNKKPFYSFC